MRHVWFWIMWASGAACVFTPGHTIESAIYFAAAAVIAAMQK